jgi:hypothetical protein
MADRRFGRRSFIGGVGAAGTAVLIGTRSGVAGAAPQTRLVKVYRLSTRGMVVCSACKAHAAHRFFRRERFANHGRAHKRCNCRILEQRIPRRTWNQYFANADGSLRREWDDRW